MKQLYKNTNEYINDNRSSTKKIYVFLTKEEYKKLNDLKYQYRLSISIIAEIIYINTAMNQDLMKVCKNEQLYRADRKANKMTCLKFNTKQFQENEICKAKFVNNAIIIFVNKQEKNYVNEKQAEKLRNRIYAAFQNTIDPFYNYNENIRQFYYMKEHILHD